jgi:recombination protein RecA
VDLASELGIIEKSGAWYSFGGERIGQGRENAKAYLEQHQDVMDRIESMVLAKNGIQRAGAPSAPVSESNGAGHVEEKVARKSAASSRN